MKQKKTKQRSLTEIDRRIKQVQAYQLPSGPFDYATRAQGAREAQKFFHEVVCACRQYHNAPEADAVIEAARRLYLTAIEMSYPPGFWEDYERLHAGDPAGLENAVSFLEADPYFDGSGYVKQKLIRAIKAPMLAPDHVARLQRVVLAVVDKRYDRDMRNYRNLAWKVNSPQLSAQLAQRVTSGDFDVRKRARWVLEALVQKGKME